jgi:hypothetical protein
MHTHIFNTLIKKFLLPLNKALVELNVQCKKWAVTRAPALVTLIINPDRRVYISGYLINKVNSKLKKPTTSARKKKLT